MEFGKEKILNGMQSTIIALKTVRIISKNNELDVYKSYHYLEMSNISLGIVIDICDNFQDCEIGEQLEEIAKKINSLLNDIAENLIADKSFSDIWTKYRIAELDNSIALINKAYLDITHSQFMIKV